MGFTNICPKPNNANGTHAFTIQYNGYLIKVCTYKHGKSMMTNKSQSIATAASQHVCSSSTVLWYDITMLQEQILERDCYY